MSAQQKAILNTQNAIYDFLVRRGRVTQQIANSQAISESMSAVIPDIIRIARDDQLVAEAVATVRRIPFLNLVEAGVVVHCASTNQPWVVYDSTLYLVNPLDSAQHNEATAWARREGLVLREIGVIAMSLLTQFRALHKPDDEELTDVDEALALAQCEDFVRQASAQDASDIHFVPGEGGKVDLKFRIDGILRSHRKIDAVLYGSMLRGVLEDRCKVTYLALAQQDGKFELQIDSNKSISIRVSTLPVECATESVPKMVMRLLGNNSSLANLNRMGLSTSNYEKLVRYGNYPSGLIVMTGPTGSGKTTALYAQLLNMQSTNPNRNFHTVEDPVEMQQQGMSHTAVSSQLSFAQALRALLRQDPDVILVGEMRDEETAELGYKAAMTGHLVLTTLHTNSSHESIGRLEKMGISTDLIVTNTTAFMAQRLVRRLCAECKEPYRLQDDLQRFRRYGSNKHFAKLKGEATVYRARANGCSACDNTGEKGRHGVIEILEMTAEVQVALINGMNPSLLRRKQIKEGTFEDLWDDGLRLVADGVIGFEQLEAQLKPYEVDRTDVNTPPSNVHSVPSRVTPANTDVMVDTSNQIQSL